MKKNNKGFMLAEVVVVSAVVATTLVSLYGSYSKLYRLYTERSRYYDIDGLYALNSMSDYLVSQNILNHLFSDTSFQENQYLFLIENGICSSLEGRVDDNYLSVCQNIEGLYTVKNMVITKYNNVYKNEGEIDLYFGKSNLNLNETLKNYLKYLENYYPSNSDYEDSYFIILEYGKFNDVSNEELYYSNIVLR